MQKVFYSSNPISDADRYLDYVEKSEQEYLSMCPECCCCHDKITDDEFFGIDGDIYCEDCMKDKFAFSVDLYVERMKSKAESDMIDAMEGDW